MTTATDTALRQEVTDALCTIGDGDFGTAAEHLLSALGYRSERRLPMSGDVDDFIRTLPARNPNTQTERRFREHANSVKILFQVADTEIEASTNPTLFADTQFDTGNARSFLFAAVTLNGESYPRHRYAEFTREVNKRIAIAPTVLLFRTESGLLSIAFAHRRRSKTQTNRQVLGDVRLIREIDPTDPHRAHQDILGDLSLDDRLQWMDTHDRQRNFDGLLAAWLDALDTEALNRRFYRDLFAWFERAVKDARFPTGEARTLEPQEHVIRLITRMLFVWFIKEKGLIAEELFSEPRVKGLLRDYDGDNGDSYYRAVLQNLFFATLNTEIKERDFSKQDNSTHRNFSLYRYEPEIVDTDELMDLFKRTPFINGGLFDCLDSEAATGEGGWRIDCFSDNIIRRRSKEHRMLSIPNRLFFYPDRQEPGLIDLFNRYKFTIEENTPAEQEVALDPELLGKVFENLLAANIPETRETARRQTGSYYTPRVVVDYMVDEALVTSLSETVQSADGDSNWIQDRLRYLLDHSDAFDDADDLFTLAEREAVVRAIAQVKILDPAVGSGAFPISMLHKLTLALRRLDADNRIWERLQRERALAKSQAAYEDAANQQERDAELREISDTFEKYHNPDFGRKLYVIQNSIYGVDIQPVATQIAKLRFFISLAIEQQPDYSAENYGIKPLPNLETRFVAANTLLGLKSAGSQLTLGQTERVNDLQRAIDANRERHFHANTRDKKNACRNEDKRLREELAAALRAAAFDASDAAKIAAWDPYDQNDNADWFDAAYMFGVDDGFDVVIGNPPYVQLQRDRGRLGRLYRDAGYETFARTGDIYQLFFERGCHMLTPSTGLLAYVTSNSWLKAEYGKKTRRYFSEKHTPLSLLEMGKDVFESAIVDSSVLLMREGERNKAQSAFDAVDVERIEGEEFPPAKDKWGQVHADSEAPWSILSRTEQSVMDKMNDVGTPLKEWNIEIYRGITTGSNEAFIIDNQTKEALVAADPKSAEVLKQVLRGRDIRRYQANWEGKWLISTFPAANVNIDDYPAVRKHLLSYGKARLEQTGRTHPDGTKSRKKTHHSWFELQDTCAYHEDFKKEKLFWMDMTPRGRFSYSGNEVYCNDKGFMMTGASLKYLCAVLNSSLITWRMRSAALTTGMGLLQWKKFAVERIPVPRIGPTEQNVFIQLVDGILQAKAEDRSFDPSGDQAEIDRKVYELYGLTPSEILATGQ